MPLPERPLGQPRPCEVTIIQTDSIKMLCGQALHSTKIDVVHKATEKSSPVGRLEKRTGKVRSQKFALAKFSLHENGMSKQSLEKITVLKNCLIKNGRRQQGLAHMYVVPMRARENTAGAHCVFEYHPG